MKYFLFKKYLGLYIEPFNTWSILRSTKISPSKMQTKKTPH